MTLVTLTPAAEGFSRKLRIARASTESPFTLTSQEQDWGGATWVFSFKTVQMSALDDGRTFGGLLERLSFTGENFLLLDPTAEQPRFSGQVVTLLQDALAGDLVLQLGGLAPQVLNVGDLLSLPREDGFWDMHRVLDVEFDSGAGQQHVAVAPAVRRGYALGTEAELVRPLVTVKLENSGGLENNFTHPYNISYVFQAREATR